MSVLIWGIDDARPEEICEKPLKLLQDFKQSYPHVKITLFVTPDWVHKPQKKLLDLDFLGILKFFMKYDHWPEGTFRIDKHKEWINELKDFEIGDHGLNHLQKRRPVSAEFEQLNYEQCVDKLKRIMEIFGNVGIRPEGFAPPGWGVNVNLIKALADFEFKYIAGSIDNSVVVGKNSLSNQAGIKNVSAFFPTNLGKVVNVPRNWDIHKSDVKRAEDIIRVGGVLGLHGHVMDDYMQQKIGNGITEENLKNVEKLLDFVEKNSPEVEYKTFSELSQDVLAKGPEQQT